MAREITYSDFRFWYSCLIMFNNACVKLKICIRYKCTDMFKLNTLF